MIGAVQREGYTLVPLSVYFNERGMAKVELGLAIGKKQHDKRASEKDLDAIIRKATELKAVIFQHTWFKQDGTQYPGESTPLDLVELAKRHPHTHFICGHAGGQWEMGIRAIRAHKNISIELAGSDPTAGFTEMAVRELGPERIIYGSDSAGRSFASQLAKVYGANIPDAAKRLIFSENLRSLVETALRAKKA